MRKRSVRSKGQMAVLVTMAMPVLLGAIALCTDVGLSYFNWEWLQRAADAGALAGASYLPDNSYTPANSACASYADGPQQAACDYVVNNGVKPAEISSIALAQSGGENTSVTVSLARTIPAMFGKVIGINTYSMSAAATAGGQATTQVDTTNQSWSNLIPIGLQYNTPFAYGESIAMHNVAGGDGPGNWGGLALGGSGGSQYESNLANGYIGLVIVTNSVNGLLIQSEPGNKVGPTQQGITTRLTNAEAADPSGTWQVHTPNDPRAAIIPLVDWTGCNGTCSVPVKGFAEVWITGVPSASEIDGIFIGGVAPGAQHSTSTTTSPGLGPFDIVLEK